MCGPFMHNTDLTEDYGTEARNITARKLTATAFYKSSARMWLVFLTIFDAFQ